MPINKVVYGDTTLLDLTNSTLQSSDELINGVTAYDRSGTLLTGTAEYMELVDNPVADDILITDADGQAVDSGVSIDDVVQFSNVATDNDYGVVKTNSSQSITLNANGQLEVGGRLGQFPNGGVYYPPSSPPTSEGNYSFLISEAIGLSLAHREFIIAGGSNVTLKTTAQAGATEYRISNTMTNRFMCLPWVDGRLAVDEASAKDKTVAITSIKFANGNNISAYFGATESNNDIIITVAESLNPSGTLSSVRGYGTWKNADIISAGQGNYVGGGKTLQVGQGLSTGNSRNQIAQIGIRMFSDAASSIQVGADNINKKAFSAMFGQGIDNTNGIEAGGYFGKYPDVSSDTAFVVGNGTAYNAKSNLFEIKTNGDIYVNGVLKISG